jgi:hypothetical protein
VSDYEKVIREIKSDAVRYRAIEDALAAKPSEDDVWLQ